MTRTFRDLIAANRRRSAGLLVGFLALFTVTIYVFAMVAIGEDPRAGIVPALGGLGLGLVVALFAYYGGAGAVLAMSGAKAITREQDPQLWNVVEELAIASGLPMPRVHLIDDTALNAFATGRDPAHASVAITRGLRDRLDRAELQGVLAHEMSHIRNFDIRFAMLLAVLVGLLALIADGFRRWLWWGGGRRRSPRGQGGAIMGVIALFALLLAVFAPILGKLIQLAASREREFLADASAVELTRYPDGLASALEKLGQDREVLEVANRATQHLYIVNPFRPFETRAKGLLSTHPPLEERIRRLRALSGSVPSAS